MWASLRRVPAFVLTSILLTGLAYAGDGGGQGPSARGPIFDITHFDVLPVNLDTPDSFEQAAYTALFAYRDASLSDPGSKSFRMVNWLLAPNHSQIIDVWGSLDAFEAHLAQTHSTDFRFAVQLQPPPPPPAFNCCIGSPIDDRQYSLVKSFNLPWISSRLPTGVGATDSALFVVTLCRFPEGWRPRQGPGRIGALRHRHQQGVRPTELYRPAAARPAKPLRHFGGLGLRRTLQQLAERSDHDQFRRQSDALARLPIRSSAQHPVWRDLCRRDGLHVSLTRRGACGLREPGTPRLKGSPRSRHRLADPLGDDPVARKTTRPYSRDAVHGLMRVRPQPANTLGHRTPRCRSGTGEGDSRRRQAKVSPIGEASFTPRERNLRVVCRDGDNQVHLVERHHTFLVGTTFKEGARPTDRHYSDEYESAVTQ